MTTADSLTTRPSGRNWLLIASLAVNLLIFGGFAGAVATYGWHHGPPFNPGGHGDLWAPGRMITGEQGLPGFVRTLPPERRKVFHPIAHQAQQAIKPLRQAVQQQRVAMQAALQAEPFDGPRFEKALDELFTAEGAARRATASTLVSVLSLMTPEERAQFYRWRKAHDQLPAPPSQPPAPEPATNPK